MRSLTTLGLTLRSSSSSSSLPFTCNFRFFSPPSSSRLYRRFHFLKPCSSLKQTKKKKQQSLPSTAPPPQSLRWFFNPKSSDDDNDEDDVKSSAAESDADGGSEGDAAIKGTILAGVLLIGTVGGFAGVGYVYRDQINTFLTQFSTYIEGYGTAGYALFIAVYAGLEILAIPALPLTMSAGLLFGPLVGTIIVSISGTMAASVAFLIARYFARERILKLVEDNKKFLAIDKAIGENGFRVVTLLRLSPLLPFSLGNYLYGLTSVKFVPYVLGSWLGMLPGSWAYVSAGAFGRAIIQEESNVGLPGGNGQLLTLGVGLLVTALAATYVTGLAKDAIQDIDDDK
ncbi:SNARE domain associated Golgi protein [Arabidopsis thaliana x Arabidopsis arenosa]|uniref:SNARE domain associated Golgi protein n=1 Tax=Arabidopsis thaliana x Arabidopsis arenosa TaxID=1240361 RepID=A0A8T2C0B7_9BRAS|nr:SNARE domain associated Golgi protein [Arabidopsis thaliana x Arabidopsis arenosa]